MYSNHHAFVALNKDSGTAHCWGDATYGGVCNSLDFSDVTDVYSTWYAFAAVKSAVGFGSVKTWSVMCWGASGFGGNCGSITLGGKARIYSTGQAFMALEISSGAAKCWGNALFGGECAAKTLSADYSIFNTWYAFAALDKSTGNGECWGANEYGGDCQALNFQGITNIYSTGYAFMALSDSTSLVLCWGDSSLGGECAGRSFPSLLGVYSNGNSFAVLSGTTTTTTTMAATTLTTSSSTTTLTLAATTTYTSTTLTSTIAATTSSAITTTTSSTTNTTRPPQPMTTSPQATTLTTSTPFASTTTLSSTTTTIEPITTTLRTNRITPVTTTTSTSTSSTAPWTMLSTTSTLMIEERPLYISLSFQVLNVKYASLVANSLLLAAFVERIREAIASDASAHGAQTQSEHVTVLLSAGSVIVKAGIAPANVTTSERTLSALSSSSTLAETVEAQVRSLSGISEVTTGAVQASEISVQSHRDVLTLCSAIDAPTSVATTPLPPVSSMTSSTSIETTSTASSAPTTISALQTVSPTPGPPPCPTPAPTLAPATLAAGGSEDDSFQPIIFVIGMAFLAFGGFCGTIYYWRLTERLKKVRASEAAERKEHADAVNHAQRELQRSKNESEVLMKKLKNSISEASSPDRQREAEVLKKERDDALLEVRKLQTQMQEAKKQRDLFSRKAEVAAAEAKAARETTARDGSSSARSSRSSSKEPPAPATKVNVEGLEGLFAEIEEAMVKLRKVPQKERASELRSLKRSYHPDAQKLKSPAVQELFTTLSQHVNGFCDAHLRHNCQACSSAI